VQRKARKLDEYEKKLRQANSSSNNTNSNSGADVDATDYAVQELNIPNANNTSISFTSPQAYPGLPHSSKYDIRS
jgi:hypothetical protein